LIEHAGIAVPMLTELADHAPLVRRWLAAAATGEARVAVQPPQNPFLFRAADADILLLSCADEVHLIEPAQARLTARPSIDLLRPLHSVEWEPTPETRIASGDLARAVWERALARGAIFSAAQCNGLAAKLVEMAVAYAAERRQFGKPIAVHQSLKHQLADAQIAVHFARPIVWSGATRIADRDDASAAVISSAKLAATRAADKSARAALQVHGAMGYSWEVDLHFYMKRAWALAGEWGDWNFHSRRVQSLVLGGRVATGPGETFRPHAIGQS
jgi:Acyl-CoA dehydrogenase, C-terminal domain